MIEQNRAALIIWDREARPIMKEAIATLIQLDPENPAHTRHYKAITRRVKELSRYLGVILSKQLTAEIDVAIGKIVDALTENIIDAREAIALAHFGDDI